MSPNLSLQQLQSQLVEYFWRLWLVSSQKSFDFSLSTNLARIRFNKADSLKLNLTFYVSARSPCSDRKSQHKQIKKKYNHNNNISSGGDGKQIEPKDSNQEFRSHLWNGASNGRHDRPIFLGSRIRIENERNRCLSGLWWSAGCGKA